jgi:pimeloyl-ACP methyl ester carboxylesterase/predicted glycosyltransferase
MRARTPERSGYVERDGIRVYYEQHGSGEHTIVFVPSDTFVTSECWKGQVPYLARHHRVVAIDPRGNGRSDKPTVKEAYTGREMVADLIAVMDELDIERGTFVGLCMSSFYALAAAAWHPERADGVVAVGTWIGDGTPRPDRGTEWYDDLGTHWEAPWDGEPAWHLLNRELWLSDWPRWPEFFFSVVANDPHSTKVYEDLVGWACQSTGAVQVAAGEVSLEAETPEDALDLLAQVRCPVLTVHGTLDICQPFGRGANIARLTGGELLALGGAGHVPTGRDPVVVNHAIADFVDRVHSGRAEPSHTGPARVRAHLSTRREAAPDLPEGRRIGAGTAYGELPPGVVVLDADVPGWREQVAAPAWRAGALVVDGGASPDELVSTLSTAGVHEGVLFAPPGTTVDAAAVHPHVAAAVRVEAPEAIRTQPGLLDFFLERLPLDRDPASVAAALCVAPQRRPEDRAVVLAIVDDPGDEVSGLVDARATVEGGVAARPVVRRARGRRDRRLLYLSSPIGLGHVRRDLAIADALREQVPGLEVDWLSQSPVTEFLERRGERVHPASQWLATESAHIEAEAGEHDLHAFQAIRRMDEILVSNFHVFDDLVREQSYDAWVGDEAWDLDHFLHENPRLKRAPFVWMTDFVGWLPMPDGGEHEAALTADYNAEMVEHVARYPGLRDRAVFVGDPDDVVPGSLGPGLPDIREWTEEHFEFSGYVTGDRSATADRSALRSRLGYADDETVCMVSVGGSGVGEPLLRRVVEAYDACHGRVPSLRMHVVTGPRLDPDSVKAPDGVTVHGFVPDLDLHHAACDVAVVQGGLSTTMELTAANRPFLYFPLRHHFEQQFHVRHRLDRHGAGRAMDFDTGDPEVIAQALVDALEQPCRYVAVPEDGAERAARLVAEVL